MKVNMIAAMNTKRVIGINGKIPWVLPEDLQYFKKMTLGSSIVMGRKTWESFKGKLPGRTHYVMTRDKHYTIDDTDVNIIHSKQELYDKLDRDKKLFIIGGEEIYKLFLDDAEKIYLTIVSNNSTGDAHFPKLKENWVLSYTSDITMTKPKHMYTQYINKNLRSTYVRRIHRSW